MKILRNEFFVAFILLAAFLLTNSYIYSWDDQHVEIPLLKHLIDPSLYVGDYYVEGLAKHFTTYLYPILSHIITVKQIPATYFILFLLSRYAMFYWAYRLWLFISGGNRFAAFSACLMFFLLGRTEEFLYRTFSHQEFSYIFMFAAIYFFYRERYILAAMIFGIGANFHAIYNLFPMLYMLTFLLFCHPKRFSMIVKTGLVFTFFCLPFLCWQIPNSLAHDLASKSVPASEWIPLYLLSCPQNFIFGDTPVAEVWANVHIWLVQLAPYLMLTALYCFHWMFNPRFRRDNKMHAIFGLSWFLMLVAYYFHYIHPSRFVLDLNVIRVEQIVRFFLMGYTTVWAVEQVQSRKPWLALLAAVLMVAVGTTDLVGLMFMSVIAVAFLVDLYVQSKVTPLKTVGLIIFAFLAGTLAYLLAMEIKTYAYIPFLWRKVMYITLGMGIVFVCLRFKPNHVWLRRFLIIIPLTGIFIHFLIFHYNYLQDKDHGTGFWQFQRNWWDMQYYVRDHTPKDALILAPYNTDMGGFRINSERKVLVCYRDCGIIGFDYAAAVEWQKRIKDVESFKMMTNKPVTDAVVKAILKYHVDYIVFMNYYQPGPDNPVLKKLYQNEVLSLYQVMVKLPPGVNS